MVDESAISEKLRHPVRQHKGDRYSLRENKASPQGEECGVNRYHIAASEKPGVWIY